jgi:hypothetical protein
VEGQAAAILKQNELLERRMAALEQHVEVREGCEHCGSRGSQGYELLLVRSVRW